MSRNRRKNANTVRAATFFWWLVVFAGLSVLGLSYVSIKNQTIAFADDRQKLEGSLKRLNDENRALGSQVTALTSYSTLQRQLQSGFIKLVEIDQTRVVRLNASGHQPTIIADALASSKILAQK
ncbi:MAG TPA: hypothetical protein VF585_09750 [Chthoniobacterales bacterium]|jgi:hypothetical protein